MGDDEERGFDAEETATLADEIQLDEEQTPPLAHERSLAPLQTTKKPLRHYWQRGLECFKLACFWLQVQVRCEHREDTRRFCTSCRACRFECTVRVT